MLMPVISGEELSKKQAAQEGQIRKLRAQVCNECLRLSLLLVPTILLLLLSPVYFVRVLD